MERRDIVVVATSTGGLEALKQLCGTLPRDLPASVFVVMHIGAYPSILPAILQSVCNLPVRHAADNEPFALSTICIAPSDRHLLLLHGRTLLSNGPKENFTRPAADPLFRSAAVTYGRRVIGVVLTGDLDDGAAGMRVVRACGGFTIVQDPADCRSPSMPINALRATTADVVAPIAELSTAIRQALEATMTTPKEHNQADALAAESEDRMMRTGKIELADLDAIGVRSSLTCPDCGGVVWRIGSGMPLRYRCHTGHAFSAVALEDEQRRQSENAIWQALRAIEERIFLAREQLEEGKLAGHDVSHLVARVATLEEAKASTMRIVREGLINA
ncbi:MULTISPECIES: chemotaxis protein CheB [unclassified Caballeronia]|uniref:chemotaxis protein CheB n=1 Tax=unclassified Caballeronia TaxID=2646786 RepID=UPI00285CA665|nr:MULTISPECIES: chemotaxis protein CheB [unclassified Caballeronia]MDR5777532.1 chemotaxis protein CheB [Caballeronia sp. LZ002]MDR5852962.1 chemotaxis protein CheB [Caballeronia sp. LZ003]